MVPGDPALATGDPEVLPASLEVLFTTRVSQVDPPICWVLGGMGLLNPGESMVEMSPDEMLLLLLLFMTKLLLLLLFPTMKLPFNEGDNPEKVPGPGRVERTPLPEGVCVALPLKGVLSSGTLTPVDFSTSATRDSTVLGGGGAGVVGAGAPIGNELVGVETP